MQVCNFITYGNYCYITGYISLIRNSLTSKCFFSYLDILILNAAVFGLPYTETVDKLETTFQVNYLSHLYFAILLEPLLKKGSRVIFVSSESHR